MPSVCERAFDRFVIAATARPDEVEQEIAERWRLGRDHEVLGDREVVEELERLPRAPEAGAGPPVRRRAIRLTGRRTRCGPSPGRIR